MNIVVNVFCQSGVGTGPSHGAQSDPFSFAQNEPGFDRAPATAGPAASPQVSTFAALLNSTTFRALEFLKHTCVLFYAKMHLINLTPT